MCGLGQTASNPVLSTLRYFRNEYLEHIEHKRCPAGVCKALITYSINENCTGCQLLPSKLSVGGDHGREERSRRIDHEQMHQVRRVQECLQV